MWEIIENRVDIEGTWGGRTQQPVEEHGGNQTQTKHRTQQTLWWRTIDGTQQTLGELHTKRSSSLESTPHPPPSTCLLWGGGAKSVRNIMSTPQTFTAPLDSDTLVPQHDTKYVHRLKATQYLWRPQDGGGATSRLAIDWWSINSQTVWLFINLVV